MHAINIKTVRPSNGGCAQTSVRSSEVWKCARRKCLQTHTHAHTDCQAAKQHKSPASRANACAPAPRRFCVQREMCLHLIRWQPLHTVLCVTSCHSVSAMCGRTRVTRVCVCECYFSANTSASNLLVLAQRKRFNARDTPKTYK